MRILFHAPYKITDLTSGSRVRPNMMIEAFKELGYIVDVVSGSLPERKHIYRNNVNRLEHYAFCYSEPSTYPVHPVWDYWFYYQLDKANIPLGIFYRDAYWKIVPHWTQKNIVQKTILQIRYRSDICLFNKTARVIFFPSKSLSDFFSFHNKGVLWPGCNNNIKDGEKSTFNKPYTVIYVGNIAPRYGLRLLLETMELVNEWEEVNLELVCPAESYTQNIYEFAGYKNKAWLRIHHLSGEKLEPLYDRANIGIITLLRNQYNDLAMPVKLFEYLSYGLPVVVTNCTEMASFVTNNHVGLAVTDTSKELRKAILLLLEDSGLFINSARAVHRTINNGNLWKDRANAVAQSLLEL